MIRDKEHEGIVQWNCNGIKKKKDELLAMIEEVQPLVLALQETMLNDEEYFRIPRYNAITKTGHFNWRSHGGTMLLIHESVPMTEIQLQTEAQAVAATININGSITIASVYFSRAHNFTYDILRNLIEQLPQPLLVLGDFNSYHQMWGSDMTDARGRIIEQLLTDFNLNILNNGAPTRIWGNAETAIDLSICSPRLQTTIEWTTFNSPRDGDHCPILITMTDRPVDHGIQRRDYRKINWGIFKSGEQWTDLPNDLDERDAEEIVDDFYDRINKAIDKATPQYIHKPLFPKPWWSAQLTASYEKREKAFKVYRRRKSPQNFLNWKRSRADHRKLVAEHKREAWREMAGKVSGNTPMKEVWNMVRRIRGRPPAKINILEEGGTRYTTTPEICEKIASTFETTTKSTNYDPIFRNYKQMEEGKNINITSNNLEVYNREISKAEMVAALTRARNTTPGPDNISYEMLRQLPEQAANYLLKIFNKLFKENSFPRQWRESIIIPIPKPDKNLSSPSNYRPNSLTSTICKTLERILNSRLQDYLSLIQEFALIQTGGMKRRSILDHLIGLETTVRNAFANGEHVISVFFDLEKAYDLTWKYGIVIAG